MSLHLRRVWAGRVLAVVLTAAPVALLAAIIGDTAPGLARDADTRNPARPDVAAIASAHPLATGAGIAILSQGGNAFDAAVAVAAALAVVEPANSGLGGGGFWLLHRARDGREVMVDGRERAPLAARPAHYLNAAGDPVPDRTRTGPLAAAIPGTPAALAHVAQRYGRLPLATSLAPAIRLASDGHAVSARHVQMVERRLALLQSQPATTALFLDGGLPPAIGTPLKQPDLARVLARLARVGHRGFYRGQVAAQLVTGVRAAGGLWTLHDLATYRVRERRPVVVQFPGLRLVSASPPSAGGVLLAQMLWQLDAVAPDQRHGPAWTVRQVEAMGAAYRDRSRTLGDPDHVAMDVARLTSQGHARHLMTEAGKRRTPASLGPAERVPLPERTPGTQTSHFSVIDREGNYCAVTLSLNTLFGSGFVPPHTGVLLNNEMDDFVVKDGVANVYGLAGGRANRLAGGRRPLSSMSPSFLETDGSVIVLGTPGGSRIPTMVLHATLALMDEVGGRHPPIEAAIARGRFHYQQWPHVVDYEEGALSPEERQALTAAGYPLQPREPYGNMQAIRWDRRTGQVTAGSDPRGEGAARTFR